MEVFAANVKLKPKERELKQWISLTLGICHWGLGGFAAHRGEDKKATSGNSVCTKGKTS